MGINRGTSAREEELLDLRDQDHDKSGMEENQNPEHRTDNPVKREESDSPSDTTEKQGIDYSGSHSNNIVSGSNAPQHWWSLDIKQDRKKKKKSPSVREESCWISPTRI